MYTESNICLKSEVQYLSLLFEIILSKVAFWLPYLGNTMNYIMCLKIYFCPLCSHDVRMQVAEINTKIGRMAFVIL